MYQARMTFLKNLVIMSEVGISELEKGVEEIDLSRSLMKSQTAVFDIMILAGIFLAAFAGFRGMAIITAQPLFIALTRQRIGYPLLLIQACVAMLLIYSIQDVDQKFKQAVEPETRLRFEIDRLFRENSVEIPFSQRDVHIKA